MKKNILAETKDGLISQGIFLVTEISHSIINEIGRWILSNRPEKKNFTILINSSGGTPSAVVRFASRLRLLKKEVAIHGVAFDTCGSAALALLQCCHRRSAVKHTSFFIHHVHSNLSLNCQTFDKEKIERELAESKRIEEELVHLQCERTKIDREKWMGLADRGEYKDSVPIFTDEALGLGLIDEVIDDFRCL